MIDRCGSALAAIVVVLAGLALPVGHGAADAASGCGGGLLPDGTPPDGCIFVVDTTDDTVDALPGDDVCADAAGDCSLRAAVMESNAGTSGDSVVVPAGDYVLTIAGAGEDAAASGDLDATRPLIVVGDGAGSTTIDADGLDRVFHAPGGAQLDLRRVTVTGGHVSGADEVGGGIAGGLVLLIDAVVTDNEVEATAAAGLLAGGGGGIAAELPFVHQSTISSNRALPLAGSARDVAGGGLLVTGGGSGGEVTGSTITGNSVGAGPSLGVGGTDATSDLRDLGGGGIAVVGAGTDLAVSGTAISGNSADVGGGVLIAYEGQLDLDTSSLVANTARDGAAALSMPLTDLTTTDSTMSGNIATGLGGGIFGGATVTRSLLAGNKAVDGAAVLVGGTPLFQAVELIDSTVSGNVATGGGGAALALGTTDQPGFLVLRQSTVTANDGIGVRLSNGFVELWGSVVGDQLGAADCAIVPVSSETITSHGHNLDSDGTCGLVDASDQPSTAPLLGALADHGGPSMTHRPLPGSPLVDADADCSRSSGTDQRGETRPQGDDCEIGAVEVVPFHGVEGRVTEDGSGDPLAGISVRLLESDGTCLQEPPGTPPGPLCPGTVSLVAVATTDADGAYRFDDLPAGYHQYGVRFIDPTGVHRNELFDDASNLSQAVGVYLHDDPSVTPVASAALAVAGGEVRGQVRQQGSGAVLPGVSVRLLTTGNVLVGTRTTQADGRYRFADVPSDSYVVRFIDLDGSHVSEYHLDAPTFVGATSVAVTAPATTIVDAQLASSTTGDVVGTVTEDGTGDPLPGISVRLLTTGNVLVATRTTQADGGYTFFDVAPGSYLVRWIDVGGDHVSEYHQDATTWTGASPVAVSAGAPTTVHAGLAPAP